MMYDVEHHLDEIEKHVRAARGEDIQRTPWDFALPTGDDLRQMRERCGYDIEDFAEEIGYTSNYVRNIEKPSGKAPGREYLQMSLLVFRRDWPRGDG